MYLCGTEIMYLKSISYGSDLPPQISDDYLNTVKSLSPEKRSEQMSKIQKMFNRAKEFSDDKVQLAIQTYELVGAGGSWVIYMDWIVHNVSVYFLLILYWRVNDGLSVQKVSIFWQFLIPFQVDKHIRRLDSDLAKFEAEIKEKALNNNKKEEETNSKKSKLTVRVAFTITQFFFLFFPSYTYCTSFTAAASNI